jgi:hypothetical protein
VVRVDGVEVLRIDPRSLRERHDLWQSSTEHPFEVGKHQVVLRVRPGMVRYDIELVVDGRSIVDDLPAGPLRPPAYGRYSYAWIKVGLASLPLLAYLLVILGLVGPIARVLGPRWVLAAEVLMNAWIPVIAVVLVIFAWQTSQRGRNVSIALIFFVVTLVLSRNTFAEAADLMLPFDEESVAFAGWEPVSLEMRRVTFVGGPEVEFANFIKVRYRRLPPGAYVLVRGHFSRLIVDMREATAAAN